jgi:D-serine deaminase-like pyridoxal phosphate-dependent protein
LVDVNPARLRPHVKTHKTKEVNDLLLEAGITKFKCATIAEAELLALSNAPDVLLSMQLIGPNISRFLQLKEAYPSTQFSSIIDDIQAAKALNEAFEGSNTGVYIDLNMGMNRTGIRPEKAFDLIQQLHKLPHVSLRGLHAYDGHIRDKEFQEREKHVNSDFVSFYQLIEQLDTNDLDSLPAARELSSFLMRDMQPFFQKTLLNMGLKSFPESFQNPQKRPFALI